MAEEAPPKGKGSAGKGLKKKIGPLPAWGWGVIVVGGILGIMLVRKWMADQAGASASGANITGGGVGSGGGALGGAMPTGPDITAQLQSLADQVTQSSQAQTAALQSESTAQTQATQSLSQAMKDAVSTLQGEITSLGSQPTGGSAGATSPTDLNQSLLNWWKANESRLGLSGDYPSVPVAFTSGGQSAYYLPGSGTGFVNASTFNDAVAQHLASAFPIASGVATGGTHNPGPQYNQPINVSV